jgi:hypothetical protein
MSQRTALEALIAWAYFSVSGNRTKAFIGVLLSVGEFRIEASPVAGRNLTARAIGINDI